MFTKAHESFNQAYWAKHQANRELLPSGTKECLALAVYAHTFYMLLPHLPCDLVGNM